MLDTNLSREAIIHEAETRARNSGAQLPRRAMKDGGKRKCVGCRLFNKKDIPVCGLTLHKALFFGEHTFGKVCIAISQRTHDIDYNMRLHLYDRSPWPRTSVADKGTQTLQILPYVC